MRLFIMNSFFWGQSSTSTAFILTAKKVENCPRRHVGFSASRKFRTGINSFCSLGCLKIIYRFNSVNDFYRVLNVAYDFIHRFVGQSAFVQGGPVNGG